jgi:hypothetical protein
MEMETGMRFEGRRMGRSKAKSSFWMTARRPRTCNSGILRSELGRASQRAGRHAGHSRFKQLRSRILDWAISIPAQASRADCRNDKFHRPVSGLDRVHYTNAFDEVDATVEYVVRKLVSQTSS